MDPIAIVGIGCRLPGQIKSPQDLWEMIMKEKIASTDRVPTSRFNIDAYRHQNNDRPGSFSMPGGYFLDDHPEDFDPTFFKISPVEAMWMDPQQRKLLEVVYEAFENSGSTLEQVSRQVTGCFVASFTSDFQQMVLKEPDFRHSYATTGVDPGILGNRISHVFDLKGPSVLMNTACSSSMYALNSACLAIHKGECEGAVVGGTNWILAVDQHMNTARLGVLSPTSTCHTFDEAADGYGRAEAVGALYVKRLSAALRDGNPVRAVIRSVACNSNGRHSDNGITYPSLQGQADVITMAHRLGNLDLDCTPYIECHGTGTPTGDPVEIRAISKALRNGSQAQDPVLVGSVKPNIGHSEPASTICTITKAVLTLEHGIIPATAGVKTLNPNIPWDALNVKVITIPTPFPTNLSCRRIGVSAFGYGGTNGHAILESTDSFLSDYCGYRRPRELTPIMQNGYHHRNETRAHLLLLSAHDQPTLLKNAETLGKFCTSTNIFDLAYTLATHREEHQTRTFAVCRESSCDASSYFATKNVATSSGTRAIAFVCTGQGAQWARMGHRLLQIYPSFLQTIRTLDEYLQRMFDPPSWKIEHALTESEESSRIHEPGFSQPLCTAIQVALVDLLERWGVRPQATIGHSSGEIAAAYAAGKISAQNAIVTAYLRGKAVSSRTQQQGAMLAVGLGADQATPYVSQYEPRVVVACQNSPESVTISGDGDAINELKSNLDAKGIFARVLRTGGQAYHSHHMKEVSLHYLALLEKEYAGLDSTATLKPQVPLFSTVTGKPVQPKAMNAIYWQDNLTSPVLFNEAMQNMLTSDHKPDIVIEIGPHSTFSGPMRQICKSANLSTVTYLSTLKRKEDDQIQLLKLAGELWMRNVAIDKATVTGVEQPREDNPSHLKMGQLLVDLPPYQWSYTKRLWAESRQSREHRFSPHPRHDILGRKVIGTSTLEPVWRNVLRHRDLPWLKHHSLGGEAVFPAAAYFAMAIEAITQVNSALKDPLRIINHTLRDVTISSAMVVPDDDEGVETLFALRPCSQDTAHAPLWYSFTVSSLSYAEWKVHATGTIGLNIRKGRDPKPLPRLPYSTPYKSWNDKLRTLGFDFGASFQNSTVVRADGTSHHVQADIRIAQKCGLISGEESRYVMHPANIDSCLHLSLMAIPNGRVDDVTAGVVLTHFDELTIWPPAPEDLASTELTVACWTKRKGVRSSICESQLVGHDEKLLAHFDGFQCVAYEVAKLRGVDDLQQDLYAKEHWELDVRYLRNAVVAGTTPELSTRRFFELFVHKDATMRILLLGGMLLQYLPEHRFGVRITVLVDSQEEVERLGQVHVGENGVDILRLTDFPSIHDVLEDGEAYDLIICAPDVAVVDMLSSLRPLLKHQGELLTLQNRDSESPGSGPPSALRKAYSLVVEDCNITSWEFADDGPTNGASDSSSEGARSPKPVLIIYDAFPSPIQETLATLLSQHGFSVRTSPLHSAAPNPNEKIIVLADISSPTFSTMTSSKMRSLQTLTSGMASIIWVTAGALHKGLRPEHGMARGWARVLRNENHLLDLRLIDIDDCAASRDRLHNVVVGILEHWTTERNGGGDGELEYYISDGLVHVSRLVPAHHLNTAFVRPLETTKTVPMCDAPPLTAVSTSGNISFHRDTRSIAAVELAPTKVEIVVRAIGLNEEDASVACGTDPSPYFSHEIAGTITAVGAAVPPGFAVGDRVFGFSFDTMATVQRTRFDLVQRMGDEEEFEQMAALPMACATALYALEHLARVEPRDNVVIVDGCGIAGLVAVQVCAAMGAHAIVVTDSELTEDVFRSSGIPHTRIVRFDKDDACEMLDRLATNDTINTIFCSHSSPPLQVEACSRALAPFGRIVMYGKQEHSSPPFVSAARNASVLKYDVRDLYEHRPQDLTKYLRKTRDLLRNGTIRPISPLTVKRPVELNETFRSLSSNIGDGKVVITYSPTDEIAYHESRNTLHFSPSATYLLVGCLGGLGRALSTWMIERGARRLALLSRSGSDHPAAADLVASIVQQGVNVDILRADASCKAQVEEAIARLDAKYPVRGVVNAAVVLREAFFQNLSVDWWRQALEPKVTASRVLHELFSGRDDLDFFVMTSSIAGILGGAGQSNYAAANAYLDALAHHRRTLGLPAVSLILPAITDVGYVAENPEVEASIRRRGMSCISSSEMLRAFEIAMTPINQLPQGSDHIIVGMQPRQLAESTEAAKSDLAWLRTPRFRTLAAAIKEHSTPLTKATQKSILALIESASSEANALEVIESSIAERLSRLLMISVEDIQGGGKSLANFGLDSMIGSEFRNWIFREFGVDLPFQQLLAGNLTIAKLAADLFGRIELISPP
ncbi:putative polyketide synthase [Lentithecium fluviatile CBS 122367]|uniref:Putative polyketide synthase n=1 Tax=Lentithecium fluviatile CBS 122367 TaxID=1168545 RepID=A0A6G1IYD3_9PLEO|nr:putative polyketide synthase [Lentithecium fluviatile CBS 122367]